MKSQQIAIISLHTCPWQQPGIVDAGGMNVYVRQTATELADRGWSVDVFTRSHEGSPPSVVEKFPGVRLVHVSTGFLDTPKDELGSQVGTFVAGVLDFAAREDTEYRAVISHYWLSGLAAIELGKRWRARHVAAFHTLGQSKQAASPKELLPIDRLHGEREVVAQADHLLAMSEHERGEFYAKYGAKPGCVSVASPGVDGARFHPLSQAACRRELGLPEQGQFVLAVGRITPIKGIEVFLRALALVKGPTAGAILVGGSLGTGDHESIQALVSELGLRERVHILGSVPHERMPLCYGASDVCVVPSFYESFGLVALEAVACGRPVIASRVGGLESIVREGVDGLLVTPGSVEELAAALTQLLSTGRCLDKSALDSAPQLLGWSDTADVIESAIGELVEVGE